MKTGKFKFTLTIFNINIFGTQTIKINTSRVNCENLNDVYGELKTRSEGSNSTELVILR